MAAPGPVHAYLAEDHDRLGRLLDRALAGNDSLDIVSYDAFRSGLLRHIGLEERLLFPPARRLGDVSVQAMIGRLHQEHALFAAMLVPTPTVELLTQLRELLGAHNLREEGPDGIYELTERVAGDQASALAAELRAGPEARVAPHYDTALALENIQVLLRALEQE
jgi:hypothetical protein